MRCGQRLILGQFQGQVTEISDDDVILKADGERWLVALGENLGEALALPPEFPSPPELSEDPAPLCAATLEKAVQPAWGD